MRFVEDAVPGRQALVEGLLNFLQRETWGSTSDRSGKPSRRGRTSPGRSGGEPEAAEVGLLGAHYGEQGTGQPRSRSRCIAQPEFF